MKITSRVLTDAVLAANQSVLADYPSGLRVVGPDGNGLYSMQLIPRKTGGSPIISCPALLFVLPMSPGARKGGRRPSMTVLLMPLLVRCGS